MERGIEMEMGRADVKEFDVIWIAGRAQVSDGICLFGCQSKWGACIYDYHIKRLSEDWAEVEIEEKSCSFARKIYIIFKYNISIKYQYNISIK